MYNNTEYIQKTAMVRNAKNTKNKRGEGDGEIIAIRVDRKTKLLWNKAVQTTNMSEWLRAQLWHHFGGHLTRDQKIQLMKEELILLQELRDKNVKEQVMKINKMQGEFDYKINKLADQITELKDIPNLEIQ